MVDFVKLPKEEAKKIGHKYRYGTKCKVHGEGVARYVSDNSCVICKYEKSSITKRAQERLKKALEEYSSDPSEEWKPVNVEDYREDYQVSNKGRVWSNYRQVPNGRGCYRGVGGKLLCQSDDGDGYPSVGLTAHGASHTVRVHRIVVFTFNPDPPDDGKEYQVNHIDGDKWNNIPSNLEWVTTQENTAHAVETGLWDKRNEKAVNSKLTWEDVDYIRKNYKYKCPVNNAVRIAERLGVESTSVYNVLTNYTWNEDYRDV